MKNLLLTLLTLFIISGAQAQNCSVSLYYPTYNCPDFVFNPLITIDTNDQLSTAFWDFGDGNTATTWNGFHTYGSDGTYIVCFTLTTVNGCSATACDTVVVACSQPGAPCDSYFTVADSACPGLLFAAWTEFTGNVSSFYFDFGDGSSSSNPGTHWNGHGYTSNGNYIVCLTVTTIDSCVSTYCDTITIACINDVEELEASLINLSPNPVSDQATIYLPDARRVWICITDLNGKLYRDEGRNVSDKHVLNLADLENGVYFVTVVLDESKRVFRLVKD